MVSTGAVYVVCLMGVLGASTSYNTAKDICVVKVLNAYDGGDFSCKVKGLDGVGSLPLRIRIRGLEPVGSDGKARERREFVSRGLSNAGRIILKNIRMRNYFRAEADVEVDGKSLGDALVAGGLARHRQPPAEKTTSPASSKSILPLTSRQPAAPGSNRPGVTGGLGPVRRPANPLATLKTPTTSDLSNITEDTTFEEALEIIRNAVDPPLPLVIMWRDIEENGYIERTTRVGIEGLGNNTSLGQVLKLVLASVSVEGAELEYVVQGGIVTVATKALGLGKRLHTRVYDASELLAAPGGTSGMFGGGGYGGAGGYGGFGGAGGYGGYGGGVGGYGGRGYGGYGGYPAVGGYGGYGSSGYNRRGNRSYNNRRPGRY